LCFLLIAALTACESAAPPEAKKKEEPKPLVPVTALSAVYKMYQVGRSWAPDLEPLEVQSFPLAAVPAKDGAFGAWQCVFVSPSKKAKKTYTFSLVEMGENLHEGVFGGPEESYSPNGSEVSFIMPAFRVDSPAALKTALEKGGGEAFQKKNANLPVMFKLIRGRRDTSPVWQVYWGANALSSPFSVYVNADTGDYIKTDR
jgi:hypothetical protein